jgi:hypothetical protein
MTKMTTLAALSAACALLCACGGGSAPPPPPAPAPPAAPTTFVYVPPASGSAEVWNRTLTDSAGTSVAMQIRQTVTAVHDDGSMVWTYDDPTGTSVAADGLVFRTTPETVNLAANGSTSDYTVTSPTGVQTSCVDSYPSAPGIAAEAERAKALGMSHVASLKVGQSWQTSYTVTCGTSAPVTFSVTAGVFPVETITVPAGTFQAFRETVSTTWTSNGFSDGTGTTAYRDTTHSLFPIKVDETIVHGDTSRPYFTHDTRELLRRE